jgi:hypothetical protein
MGKRIFQANGAQKQGGASILTSDNANFKPKLVRRDKVHIDKGNNPGRRDKNYKHTCTDPQ